jgi:hypothetical protein
MNAISNPSYTLLRKVLLALAASSCVAPVEDTGAIEAELAPGPRIVISSPAHGAWGLPTLVEGEVRNVNLANVDIELNGIPIAVDPVTREFSVAWASLPMPADSVFHRVFATIRDASTNALLASDRAVVYNPLEYNADQLDRDDNVHSAIVGRLGPTGFEDVSRIASALATEAVRAAEANQSLFQGSEPELVVPLPFEICVDIGNDLTPEEADALVALLKIALLPVFGPFSSSPAELCLTHVVVDVQVGIPGGVDLALSPETEQIDAEVSFDSLGVDAELRFNGRLSFNPLVDLVIPDPWEFDDIRLARCELDATATDVHGSVALAVEVDEDDDHRVDTHQSEDFVASIGSVDAAFDGICNLPGVNPILSILERPLTGPIENLAENVLNNPVDEDCGGPRCDTPISDTLDGILAEHELPKEIPLADDMVLYVDAPYDGVGVEDRGLTAFLASQVLPNLAAPDATVQPWSFVVYPSSTANNFRDEAPDGSTYDVASGVAFGTMNQALRSTMEMGLFDFVQSDPSINFNALSLCMPNGTGGCLPGPVTLRQVLIALGVPPAALPPVGASYELRGRATFAPVVGVPIESSAADPHPAHAHLAHYLVEIVEMLPGAERVWFSFAIDTKIGATMTTGPELGRIDFGLAPDAHGTRSEPVVFPRRLAFVAGAATALANYAIQSVVRPSIEASIETLHVPGVDDPSIAPNTAFDVSLVGAEVRDQRMVVYADIDPN